MKRKEKRSNPCEEAYVEHSLHNHPRNLVGVFSSSRHVGLKLRWARTLKINHQFPICWSRVRQADSIVVVDVFLLRGELNFRSVTCCIRDAFHLKINQSLPDNPRPWIGEDPLLLSSRSKLSEAISNVSAWEMCLYSTCWQIGKQSDIILNWEKEIKREKERENYKIFLPRKFIN